MFLSYHHPKTEDLQPFDIKDFVQSIGCQLISRAILLFPVCVMLICPHDQHCAHTNGVVPYFKISNVEYLRR